MVLSGCHTLHSYFSVALTRAGAEVREVQGELKEKEKDGGDGKCAAKVINEAV